MPTTSLNIAIFERKPNSLFKKDFSNDHMNCKVKNLGNLTTVGGYSCSRGLEYCNLYRICTGQTFSDKSFKRKFKKKCLISWKFTGYGTELLKDNHLKFGEFLGHNFDPVTDLLRLLQKCTIIFPVLHPIALMVLVRKHRLTLPKHINLLRPSDAIMRR